MSTTSNRTLIMESGSLYYLSFLSGIDPKTTFDLDFCDCFWVKTLHWAFFVSTIPQTSRWCHKSDHRWQHLFQYFTKNKDTYFHCYLLLPLAFFLFVPWWLIDVTSFQKQEERILFILVLKSLIEQNTRTCIRLCFLPYMYVLNVFLISIIWISVAWVIP